MSTRSHRLLAIFCSLQAWQRKLDGICIDRIPLSRYLNLEKLKQDRVAWIANDFKPWFPYHEHYFEMDYGEWVNEVTFSRVPIPSDTDSENKQPSIRRLNEPSGGLTERNVADAVMRMVLGFDEPLKIYGFDELERPHPFQQAFNYFMKNQEESP